MRINEFCERLYEEKEDKGPIQSVGVSKEMREFIENELIRARAEALLLKEDERKRQSQGEGKGEGVGKGEDFIPYRPIQCDEDCRSLFNFTNSISTLQRKDQKGILPNNTDQQYMFFYGWLFLVVALFVVFASYSSYPNTQDSLTLSVVFLIFVSTLYLLLKDWVLVF
jgi:hypothetical protein